MESNPIQAMERAKRCFDTCLAFGALIVLAPLFVLIGASIVVEGGWPIFYRQERLGRGRSTFPMYKFRTMVVDAESETGPVWAVASDPRTTRVGRVLRAWHLDELPQLINVLRGEMSIVGPRPERPEIAYRLEESVPGYLTRNAARPGITGLAQLRSGYDTSLRSVRRKLRYDRFYLQRSDPLFDLAILAATPIAVTRACLTARGTPPESDARSSQPASMYAGAAPTMLLPPFLPPEQLGASFPQRSASAP